jgi:hypothetical protein
MASRLHRCSNEVMCAQQEKAAEMTESSVESRVSRARKAHPSGSGLWTLDSGLCSLRAVQAEGAGDGLVGDFASVDVQALAQAGVLGQGPVEAPVGEF